MNNYQIKNSNIIKINSIIFTMETAIVTDEKHSPTKNINRRKILKNEKYSRTKNQHSFFFKQRKTNITFFNDEKPERSTTNTYL